MSFGPEEIRSAKLQAYWVEGLVNTQPLFFLVRNQPTRTVHGNGIGTGYFPLMFPTFPIACTYMNHPIELVGPDNVWRDCSLLQIEVVDYQGRPAVFSNLMLQLKINDLPTFTTMELSRLEKSLRQH